MSKCNDSPDGKHLFSPDLEYDSTGQTLNCEYCGQDQILENIFDADCCLWFGLPPCPLCNGDHGDKNCDPLDDKLYRKTVEIHKENKKLHDKIKQLQAEITYKNECAHQKNLELDAMHYVWCDGGCSSGTHRWDKSKITPEIVALAARNARRLYSWYVNHAGKDAPGTVEARRPLWDEADKQVGDALRQIAPKESELIALRSALLEINSINPELSEMNSNELGRLSVEVNDYYNQLIECVRLAKKGLDDAESCSK